MKKLSFILISLLNFVLASSMLAASAESAAIPIKDGQKLAFLGDSITQYGFQKPVGYVNLIISGFDAIGLKITPIGPRRAADLYPTPVELSAVIGNPIPESLTNQSKVIQ